MLKIFSVEQVRHADSYTIAHEPIPSIDLMERAATQCFEWILAKLAGKRSGFYIYCGPGNNGGDGLALARMLLKANYMVNIAIPDDESKYSPDFALNLNRLRDMGCSPESFQASLDWSPHEDDLVIDALFGSGLSKPVSGMMEEVISCINRMNAVIVSIDLPSGLYADKPVEKGNSIVHADYTLSFQLPKMVFLFAENEIYVGEWVILPIGLHPEFIESEPSNNLLVTHKGIQPLLKPRSKFSHKGTYGHALLIAGSLGKMGASVLASGACLRAGTGLLTSHIPQCGYEILQSAVPEAMVSLDTGHNECSRLPDLSSYSAIGIGPGLGTSVEATNVIRLILQEANVPLILDADALNILSEQKTWQAFIPAGSILTPHPKEFERLAGKTSNGFEMVQLLREYCLRQKVFIVLKGAHTITCTPGGNCFFNSTGNPGMATGGSGDVLTGIILGLLAQHYMPLEACLLGVYLHGMAGDIAALETGQDALIAGDLVNHIGQAFLSLY